jgi:hypothetical protein
MKDGRFDRRGGTGPSSGRSGGFEKLGGFRLGRFDTFGLIPGLGAGRHPIAQFLSLLVIGAAVVGVVLMGAFILSFLIGAAVLASAVLAVRIWWFRRKLRNASARAARSGTGRLSEGAGAGAGRERERVRESGDPHGRLIDAEYTIVRERDARRRGQR